MAIDQPRIETRINRILFYFFAIEIPLGDTRLLEEHDLTNVLNQLPEDAFNELFEGMSQMRMANAIKLSINKICF